MTSVNPNFTMVYGVERSLDVRVGHSIKLVRDLLAIMNGHNITEGFYKPLANEIITHLLEVQNSLANITGAPKVEKIETPNISVMFNAKNNHDATFDFIVGTTKNPFLYDTRDELRGAAQIGLHTARIAVESVLERFSQSKLSYSEAA